MEYFSLAFGLLEFVQKLIDRGSQSGELTDEQRTVLQQKADALFAKYATGPPPPPGVVP